MDKLIVEAAATPMANRNFVKTAPIALFTYNRLDHTARTINALRENEFALESDLFIFSDGPKNSNAHSSVYAVRNYLKSVSGFKSVTIIERELNFGLAKSLIEGVTLMCERHGRVIVLEDDLVTSPHFLRYMNEALDRYADNDNVISIHGYVYPVMDDLPESFLLRGADCWGWATWTRGWDCFEPDANKLMHALQASRETKVFDFDGNYPYAGMLKQQIRGDINSWAIRWYASAFLANKLTLYPGKSLIQNIGNDSSGTHCGATELFDADMALHPIRLDDIPVVSSQAGYDAFSRYFAGIRPSLYGRMKIKLKRLVDRWRAN